MTVLQPDITLNPTHRLVPLAISTRAAQAAHDGTCTVSAASLALQVGASSSSVSRAISQLEDLGHVTRLGAGPAGLRLSVHTMVSLEVAA